MTQDKICSQSICSWMFPAVFFHIEEAHQWFFRPGLSILVKSTGLRIFCLFKFGNLVFCGWSYAVGWVSKLWRASLSTRTLQSRLWKAVIKKTRKQGLRVFNIMETVETFVGWQRKISFDDRLLLNHFYLLSDRR